MAARGGGWEWEKWVNIFVCLNKLNFKKRIRSEEFGAQTGQNLKFYISHWPESILNSL